LLNSVLALNLADTELTAGMSGDVRADNTRELLVALLRALTAAAPEPAGLLVVLEDAHWLDSASWGLARAVSQHVPHVLLVVVTRPMDEPLPSEYRQLISMPTTERLVLEPLPPRETIQLVCDRLGVPDLPDLVTTLIYERGQGNPFFSEELTATLREDGFLRIVDGRCELAGTAAELEAIRFPDTVQGVISGRIDRLSPAEQLALKVASVIGRLFAVRIVRAIHPVPTEGRGLADAFGALERHDFVRCDAPEPELAYLFNHVLTQETAYSLLLFAQRQQLHQAIAEWYEQWHADDIGTYSPLLAHHWSRAEVAPRALDYLEKAGVQAVASGAYQEAVRFFGDALTLDARQATPAPAGRLGRWHRWLGEAYFSLGRLTEGREHLERAAALLDVPVPATRPRLARYVLNELLKRALVRAVPRLASPDAVQRAREAARAYERLVQIYYYANDPAQMVAVLLRGLNLAERSGPCSEIARLRAGMCVVAGSGPLRALADGYARGALEAAEVVGDVAARGWVLELIAIYRIGVGHWDDADQALSEAAEIATRLKDRRRWEEATALQSSNAYLRGNFAYAARLADDVYRSARHGGNSQGEGWGLVVRAEAALRLGEIDKAADDSQAAATLLADSAAQAEATIARAVLAKARWQQGKSQEARQAAETVLRVVAHSPALASYALEAYGSIAQVLLSLWEVDPARLSNKHPDVVGPARQACRALWKFARAFPIGQPRAYLCQGLADLLVGRPARACRAWRKSLAAADRLRMPYEQALAHYELGRHLPAADPDRAAHVAEASRLFRRLGAAIDLAPAGTPQVGDATTD
jgi:tetratricopeptide (TPR) repeat protein